MWEKYIQTGLWRTSSSELTHLHVLFDLFSCFQSLLKYFLHISIYFLLRYEQWYLSVFNKIWCRSAEILQLSNFRIYEFINQLFSCALFVSFLRHVNFNFVINVCCSAQGTLFTRTRLLLELCYTLVFSKIPYTWWFLVAYLFWSGVS